MAKAKRGRGSVAIDTVPLPEKIAGLKTLAGRIKKVRERYLLEIGDTVRQIPIVIAPAPELERMVGKKVVALVSSKGRREIVAIGTWPTPEAPAAFRRPRILCYIPAPDTFRALDARVRAEILQGLVGEGVVTPELQRELESQP